MLTRQFGKAKPLVDRLRESDLGLPVVCAGGIGTADGFVEALRMGYAGIQMGTRFIATPECNASDAYKAAILRAELKTGKRQRVRPSAWRRQAGRAGEDAGQQARQDRGLVHVDGSPVFRADGNISATLRRRRHVRITRM